MVRKSGLRSLKRPLLVLACLFETSAAQASGARALASASGTGVGAADAFPASDNRPDITRIDGYVRIDWSKLLPKVEDALTRQDGHPEALQVAVLVNGEEAAVKPYPGAETVVEVPDTPNRQRDYYLEIRDLAGHVRHRTELVMYESSEAQIVPSSAYGAYLAQNGLSIELPLSLQESGIDAALTKKSVELGYEKTVWVLSPSSEAKIRQLINEHEDVDVIPTLDGQGKAISADIIVKSTGAVLAKTVRPENFFFKVDAAFNGDCFFWDDMFVSMATIPHHPELARSTIEFWLAVQKMNGGTIPREVRKANLKSLWFEENIRAGEATTPNLHYTNPYLIHRVADELYRYNPSSENFALLQRVSQSMEQYASWIENHRAVNDDTGHLIGFVTDALGSGGDDSRGERGNTSAVNDLRAGWTDLLAQQSDLQKHLGEYDRLFAEKETASGQANLAGEHLAAALRAEAKAKSFDELLNSRYWDPRKKFYYDLISDVHGDFARDEQFETIFAFWPLLSRSTTQAQTASLSTMYLSAQKFGGAFPLPANARDLIPFADFGDDGYWGKWAHWPSTASVAIHGFEESGRRDVAYDLAVGFLKGIEQASVKTVYEFYGENRILATDGSVDIIGRPGQHRNHITRADFAGWGKVPPVYDMLEDVIGLYPQANGHLAWHLLMPMKDGEEAVINNLAYKGEQIRELRLKRMSENTVELSVQSVHPIDVDLYQYRRGEGSTSTLSAHPVASLLGQRVGGDANQAKTLLVNLAPADGLRP